MGKDFTTRWANKPEVGLTVAKSSDPRAEVSTDTKSLFTAVEKIKAELAVVEPIPAPAAGRRKKPVLALVG
jgi:hypothetical protein